MAKVQIKFDSITPFGGTFSIMEQFDALLSDVIDSTLGLRSRTYGYQYSEIIRSLMCVFFCGGSCIEDISTHLMPHLSLHPKLKICSADTILRAIKEYFYIRANRCSAFCDDMFALRGWKAEEINEIRFELNSIVVEKWKWKPHRLVIQRQRRTDDIRELWEGKNPR